MTVLTLADAWHLESLGIDPDALVTGRDLADRLRRRGMRLIRDQAPDEPGVWIGGKWRLTVRDHWKGIDLTITDTLTASSAGALAAALAAARDMNINLTEEETA